MLKDHWHLVPALQDQGKKNYILFISPSRSQLLQRVSEAAKARYFQYSCSARFSSKIIISQLTYTSYTFLWEFANSRGLKLSFAGKKRKRVRIEINTMIFLNHYMMRPCPQLR